MIRFPNAKINIGLEVIAKRTDGYHNIASLFYPVPLCDVLEIIPASKFSFASTGLPIPGNTDGNLCVKAFKLMQTHFGIGNVTIHLHKIIPMGAGMGGGSADGAFTLVMLNDIFKLNLTITQLEELALELGSDCPFFIKNKPQFATGRGEKLAVSALDLKGCYLVLVNPGIHVGTAEAYSGIKLTNKVSQALFGIESEPMNKWQNAIVNSFEEVVFTKHSIVAKIKQRLLENGAIYASMTGSGSTVFGIFENQPKKQSFENCFVWEMGL